jgi:hypothetical protein
MREIITAVTKIRACVHWVIHLCPYLLVSYQFNYFHHHNCTNKSTSDFDNYVQMGVRRSQTSVFIPGVELGLFNLLKLGGSLGNVLQKMKIVL